jgi:hypothetical protein
MLVLAFGKYSFTIFHCRIFLQQSAHFRSTTCNNSFNKLYATKGTTVNTTCLRNKCHKTLHVQTQIFTAHVRLCQQMETTQIHLQQGVGSGTFKTTVATLPQQ